MSDGQQVSTRNREGSWKNYLQEEVTAVWGDAVLIVGCFATGLLDSAVFNVWSCFVSMQTGEHHGGMVLQAKSSRKHNLRWFGRVGAARFATLEME